MKDFLSFEIKIYITGRFFAFHFCNDYGLFNPSHPGYFQNYTKIKINLKCLFSSVKIKI